MYVKITDINTYKAHVILFKGYSSHTALRKKIMLVRDSIVPVTVAVTVTLD